MGIYKTYFTEQERYTSIYGPKTIVFMQIGKFYEAYCTKTQGYQLEELESLLNIKYIRRDHDKTNTKPNQFGINCVAISKNLATLIEHKFTIVLFDEKHGETIERVCSGIFSPGTYISERQLSDAHYMISIYIEEEKQLAGPDLMAIGVTIIDITTGTSVIHEFHSSRYDEQFGLDELIRILQIFKPVELVIYFHPLIINESTIKSIHLYLELKKFNNCYFYIYHNKHGDDPLNLLTPESFKINYQNNYLSKIFDSKRKQSMIETLNLEKKTYALISLLILLKYISEHNILLLKNLTLPTHYIYNKHLILGNNAIEQLNIIDSNNLEHDNTKIKSLLDVVNRTCTPMGKRYLKENLVNPLSQENKEVIIKRYDMIEALLKDKIFKKIHHELKHINDMERLHRRMGLGIIVPYEFYRLNSFYKTTNKILSIIKDNETIKTIISDDILNDFYLYQNTYNEEYDLDLLVQHNNFNDINKSFFKKGVHSTIDAIQDNIDYVWLFINATAEYFSNILKEKCKIKNDKELINVESNDREGYYFTITKSREKILREQLNKDTITIKIGDNKTLKIKRDEIVFKPLTVGKTKIFITPLIEHTLNLSQQTEKLTKLVKRIFIKSMLDMFTKNKVMLLKISSFIAELDFLVSGSIVADQYFYQRPIIPSKESVASYIKAKNLRHAIIERLCEETEYIPNDIEIGNIPIAATDEFTTSDKNGILLFGLNSVGKSSFQKSIGIAVILAQIGYYVPAEEFVYEPYLALYARITGNDNIFKGLSSFALEMTELDAILTRTQNQGFNTLVIGDEICRGTEDTSGISIVASALVSLSECKATFIFSSHLHDLPNIKEIKELKNLRLYHLHVEYDEANDCLVFDRKLVKGSGPRVYGLMVAKYLIKNKKFINRAEIIKARLMNEEVPQLQDKVSNYNKGLFVTRCAICRHRPKDVDKELESHHINFQKNCLPDGKIKNKLHIHKNKLCNLVILCRKCHMKVHNNEITIKGYDDTSIGPILNYTWNIHEQLMELDKLEKMSKRSLLISLRSTTYG